MNTVTSRADKEESHLNLLQKPYVNLSFHTILIIAVTKLVDAPTGLRRLAET